MGITDMLKGWVLSRALKKASVVTAQGVGSYILAKSGLLQTWGLGVTVDPEMLAGALLCGSEVVRNFLKVRFPKVFSWL